MRAIVIAFVLFMLAGMASAGTQTVRLGEIVATDAALLCLDLEAAKLLSDLVDDEEIASAGQAMLALGVCGIAGGSMKITSLSYSGKRYNVFAAEDSTRKFYWVTTVSPKYD